jgi:WD40 repeat protein
VGTVKEGWSEPSQLAIYDSISHQIYKSLPLEKDIFLTSLAFSPSGNMIAAGRADGKILFIDFPNLQIVATLPGHHGAVERLIFSPDGQYLISASVDGTIRTWGLR